MPHFHIPLQSGSNNILKLMRRRYRKELYEEKVQYIKSVIPHCGIGADVITGFPGETENDFNATYEFIHGLDISYLHVFTYSERDNTFAAGMNEVIAIDERRKRNKIIRSLSSRKLNSFSRMNHGKILNVLFESEDKDGYIHGYTENYLRVKHIYDKSLINRVLPVELHFNQEEMRLYGTIENSVCIS